jgi:hypothetical protein
MYRSATRVIGCPVHAIGGNARVHLKIVTGLLRNGCCVADATVGTSSSTGTVSSTGAHLASLEDYAHGGKLHVDVDRIRGPAQR